jgi:hypothetical protein
LTPPSAYTDIATVSPASDPAPFHWGTLDLEPQFLRTLALSPAFGDASYATVDHGANAGDTEMASEPSPGPARASAMEGSDARARAAANEALDPLFSLADMLAVGPD